MPCPFRAQRARSRAAWLGRDGARGDPDDIRPARRRGRLRAARAHRRDARPPIPPGRTMLHDAREDLLAFSACPVAHLRKVWSTNPIERLHREIQRRTDVVGVCHNDAAIDRLVTPSWLSSTTSGRSPSAATSRAPLSLSSSRHPSRTPRRCAVDGSSADRVQRLPPRRSLHHHFTGRHPHRGPWHGARRSEDRYHQGGPCCLLRRGPHESRTRGPRRLICPIRRSRPS